MRNTLFTLAAVSALIAAPSTQAAELKAGLYAEFDTTKGKILLSLPPLVKHKLCGGTPASAARRRRASSSTARASRPARCGLEGFPWQRGATACIASSATRPRECRVLGLPAHGTFQSARNRTHLQEEVGRAC